MGCMKVFLLPFLLIFWSVSCLHGASSPQINHPDEFWQGLFFSYQIEKNNKIIDDHPELDRVMDIAMRIVHEAGKGTLYNFAIIKAPVANAFALPGGFIFITDKLLDLKLSDGELAFLLGHELSHVQQRHFERIQHERTKVTFLNALATIGAAVLASQSRSGTSYDRLVNQGAAGPRVGAPDIERSGPVSLPPHLAPLLAGNIFGTLYLLHSQRDYEHEADLEGARLALAAGYTVEEGMGMLQKLFYTNYRDSRYEEWTTHPLTQSRLMALKSKVETSWIKPKTSDALIDELRAEQAHKLLTIYEQLPLWQAPSFLKNSPAHHLRRVLLSRAQLLSQRSDVLKRTIKLEITTQIEPAIEKSPLLLAPYGECYEKWKQLADLGGFIPEGTLKDVKQRADESLETHTQQMHRASPGYQQLVFLLRNFPSADDAEDWRWIRWSLEPNEETKLDEATSFLIHPKHGPEARVVVKKLAHKNEQSPFIYIKAMTLLKEPIDEELLKKLLDDCEDLEEILKIQHEFPDHAQLKLVMARKAQLIYHAYRSGRLARLSQQKGKAVQHYQKVLLYDSGSELEEEVRDKIYRLNTLKSTEIPGEL